jgi:argininosuccinate lyase
MFKDAARAVWLVAAAMTDASFDVEHLKSRAGLHWITITELADTLARDHGLSFRAAHEIATALIAAEGRAVADDHGKTRMPGALAARLREVSRQVTGKEIVYTEARLADILSPRHFVEVRTTHGGPAPSETARALGVSEVCLAADDQWLATAREGLTHAGAALSSAARSL